MKTKITLENSIILTGSLFGSIYLFSTTLNIFNEEYINKYRKPFYLKVINGLVMATSGLLFLCCCDEGFKLLR